jgi:hypothetical protein
LHFHLKARAVNKNFQPEDLAMFAYLPFPALPVGNFRISALWLGAAASVTLVCLLHSGQPHAFAPQYAQEPPLEQFFPQAFIQGVPEVGLISEVRASGPYLRAVATAWPAQAVVAVRQLQGAGQGEMPTAEHDPL